MATQWQRWGVVTLMAAAGLGVGACGGGDDDKSSSADGKTETSTPAAPAGSTINVVGKEFSYDPAKLTLKAGEATKVVLKNTGSIEHDITVDDAGFKLTVPGSNTGDKVLTMDKPGTYKFHCSVAGHEDAGMKGELTVQ
jgi:uncharacterized cupredoxin-like copper-binding protein